MMAGMIIYSIPNKRTPSIQIETKNGDTKRNPVGQMPPEMETPPLGYLLLYLLHLQLYLLKYCGTYGAYCCTYCTYYFSQVLTVVPGI